MDRMNRNGIIIFLFLLFIIPSSHCQTHHNVIVFGKGDEQGLETDYNLELKQDKQAVDSALNGWWKNSMKTHDKRIDWFEKARFGCFVHWGVYSVPGGIWDGKEIHGYAEHLMRIDKIPLNVYKNKLVKTFNPVKFNADKWMRRVKEAGMKYFIITAKHHDGFAMFYSDAYPYDMRLTKYHHDPMVALRKAARKYGIKFGFYYSHAFDWENSDAPGNDWDYNNPGGDKLLYGRDWWLKDTAFIAKADKYVTEKAIPQITELIKKYKPDILWFDTPQKLPLFENIRILKSIREIAPNIVINGRLARFGDYNFGDYLDTGDRAAYFHPVKGAWESIPTTNESYGYNQVDTYHKPAGYFIRLLASAASMGGNILLNVGPMGNGEWDSADILIFKGIGKWMKVNGQSIYGTTQSPLALQNWGVCTQKDNKLYLQVFGWPKDDTLIVGGLKSNIDKAYLMADPERKSLRVKRLNPLDLSIRVPASCPDTVNTVIVLETTGKVKADSVRLLSEDSPNRLLAFDAELHGKGFTFGDGKTGKYFVENWKQNSQKVNWTVRVNEPAVYHVLLKYAGSTQAGGKFQLLLDNVSQLEGQIKTESKEGKILTLELGNLTMAKGIHVLSLEPIEINKSELMKLLEIQLLPVHK